MSEPPKRFPAPKFPGFEKKIRWTEDGIPVPYHAERNLTSSEIKDLGFAALSMPYEGRVDPETGERQVDPEFIGCTIAEVIMRQLASSAACGNLDSVKEILDRTIGKPKQQIESVTVTATYDQYLDSLAQTENQDATNDHPNSESDSP